MSQKQFVILLIVTIILQACTMPAATPTPTPDIGEPPVLLELYVATDGDDANDCVSASTACATIWGALRKATGPSVINIGPGSFYTTGVSFQPSYDTTFRGAGRDATTLLSDRTSAIIRITSALHVTIEALTIGRAVEGVTDTWGLEIREPGTRVELQDCRVTDLVHGISVWADTTLTMDNCVIENNRNGMENRGTVAVTSSTFQNNTIGLQNSGTGEFTNTTFDGNGFFDSSSGAGTATISNSGQLTLRSVDLVNNAVYAFINSGGTVEYSGGHITNNGNAGIWQHEGDFTGRSLIIADNGSYGVNLGGRSGVASAGTLRLSQSAILRNYSAGVRIDDGDLHLQNTTIAQNTATSSGGGGLWVYGGSTILLDSTVVFNSGHGLLASGSGAVITVRRSLIGLNSDTECDIGFGISSSFGTPGTYTCNDSLTQAGLGLGRLSEMGGTWVYPLLEGSPLIDAAGPPASCPGTDQRGVARPIGATCDIGAFEYTLALTASTPVSDSTPGVIPLEIQSPTPEPFTLIFTLNAFCRKGPGTRYHDVTTFKKGEQVTAEGRSESEPLWLWVLIPDKNEHCWVSSIAVTPDQNVETLTTQPAPPLPEAPSYFDATPNCSPNLNNRPMKLNWPSVPGATGYRIYRDENVLATVGSTIGIYNDTVAKTQTVTYGLEALNDNGASERLTNISLGCP